MLMPEPTLIALTGRARSGKSTAAMRIFNEYGLQRVSFSDGIKRIASDYFPDMLQEGKPRALYQAIGQNMREIDPDVWIKETVRMIKHYKRYRDFKGVIIDDLRQPNEYEWAREKGFTIIRLHANEDTRIERSKDLGDEFEAKDLRHETELYLDDYEVDYEIWNDGNDYAGFLEEIDRVMNSIEAGI